MKEKITQDMLMEGEVIEKWHFQIIIWNAFFVEEMMMLKSIILIKIEIIIN